LKVNAAGMKISTDHLPLRVSSVTVTNLPLWKASVLNGCTAVLIMDIMFLSGVE
jgi:hypothetical protein